MAKADNLQRMIGGMDQSIKTLSVGVNDLWTAIKDLKNENSSQHTAANQRFESGFRVLETSINSLSDRVAALEVAVAHRDGADGVWMLWRHGITAIVAAAVSALIAFLWKGNPPHI